VGNELAAAFELAPGFDEAEGAVVEGAEDDLGAFELAVARRRDGPIGVKNAGGERALVFLGTELEVGLVEGLGRDRPVDAQAWLAADLFEFESDAVARLFRFASAFFL
jgi:hypothetical protein